jgi:hypothetical protein
MRRMSSARRGPLATAVSAVVACLLVAGCSGSDSAAVPTPMHPGTAATSTTATPSGNPTDIAAAAAIAAVQKLYAELNTSVETGRVTGYRATFTPECLTCVRDERAIAKIYKSGGRITGGTYRVNALAVVWNKSDLIIVQGQLSAEPLVVRRGGRVVERDPALKPFSFVWKVKPIHEAWLVTEVQALK